MPAVAKLGRGGQRVNPEGQDQRTLQGLPNPAPSCVSTWARIVHVEGTVNSRRLSRGQPAKLE
jgi:hypothetical protein